MVANLHTPLLAGKSLKMRPDLRSYRLALMLTQAELAALSGCYQSDVANMEAGKIPCTISLVFSEKYAVNLIRIAKFNRITKHLTQVQLSKLSGISQKQISVLRRGRMTLKQKRFEKILAALGIPEPETTPEDIKNAYAMFERIPTDEGFRLESDIEVLGIKKRDFAAIMGISLPSLTWLFMSERFSHAMRQRVDRAILAVREEL